jgi:hypothetical protein
MILKIRSAINTYGLIFSFSITMFVLMILFAFQSSGYNAFAQNQSSPLAGMNFSKSQDVYSKNGFLKTTLVAEYKIGKVGNQTITAMVYNGSLPGPTYHVFPGDKVEIDLVNHLNESTNLHFHGMHMYLLQIIQIISFLMLLLVRHSIILLIFQKITIQGQTGIIHICINFLMDKFRQVYLACLLLKVYKSYYQSHYRISHNIPLP